MLLKLQPISYLAGVAAETTLSGSDLIGLRNSIRTHAIGGLLVLLATTALSIYKPRGMTRYGVRKQGNAAVADDSNIGTPRWVKVFGVIIIVLLLMVMVMLTGGGHGPGAHLPSG